ncbi:basic secretory protein-like protein [Sorangium sp. So ce1182]|uniref:basic secretory protein-like protein n=1 Tax=Sorangium sp. So ce1182 TaxID=3133334 RepID=UPI003F5ED2A7
MLIGTLAAGCADVGSEDQEPGELGAAGEAGQTRAVQQNIEFANEPSMRQQKVVFGFEDASHWHVSGGVLSVSSDHTEGQLALAVGGAGRAEISSTPLDRLTGVTDRLLLDVRLPIALAWGNVQLFVNSPSSNVFNRPVGSASLQGLTPGAAHELTFTLAADLQAALAQARDVVVTIELNQPATAVPTVFDHLRFAPLPGVPACGENAGFTLNVIRTHEFDEGVLENIQCRLYEMYPVLSDRFNPDAPRALNLELVDTGVAGANGDTISFNVHEFPDSSDLDAFVHEAMHIMQSGYPKGVPGWFVEGGADYIRDQYRTPGTSWSASQSWEQDQHYQHGEITGFLKWIDAHYRVGQEPMLDALDRVVREREYSPEMWGELTGVDINTMWYEYSGGRTPMPAPEGQGVTFFADVDYYETLGTFAPGEYDAAALFPRGIDRNWISSIKVPAGYSVTAYANGNFTGTRRTYTVNRRALDIMEDEIESFIVTRL